MTSRSVPDLLCLSHLRWDFVYQRPHHLMTRFAAERRVFYFEEPVLSKRKSGFVTYERHGGVRVVVPHLSAKDMQQPDAAIRSLLSKFLEEHDIRSYHLWFYAPMALHWTDHLQPLLTIYDCMDELSAFKGAPAALKDMERKLLSRADIVFTGGPSLHEAKRRQHPNTYCFPSSVDVPHFARARGKVSDPEDQAGIARPRLGYFGVIDERMDLHLISKIAELRPDWQLVMVGPLAKVDSSELPRRPNIHYVGKKTFEELPSYIAGWDAALLPFAHNESTRYISPTKTPEYLAAGKPVVSTSIRDVVFPYGELGVVHVADTPSDFVEAVQKAMAEDADGRLRKVDELLSATSWSRTWGRMAELIEDACQRGIPLRAPSQLGSTSHQPAVRPSTGPAAARPAAAY